jgi:hypothetical protein
VNVRITNILVHMKRIALVIAIMVTLLSACGREPSPSSVSGDDVALPTRIQVESTKTMEDGRLHLRGVKDDTELSFILDEDTKVYFDGPRSLTSITKDQVVYLEGKNTSCIDTAIIIEWPGIKRVDSQEIITTEDSVPEMVSGYLEERHPELGITHDTEWALKIDKYEDNWIYQNKGYLLSVNSDGFEYPAYTVMIMPDLDSQAIWSGRVNQYGEVEEYRYDQP